MIKSLILTLLLLLFSTVFAQDFTISSPQATRVDTEKPKPMPKQPPLRIRLAAEKNGERVYYTTREWKNLSAKAKGELNKIGLVVGSGDNAFLLSLYNNMSQGVWHKQVPFQEALNSTGGQLPTKKQLEIIKKNKQTINSALKTFDGDHMGAWYFWGENGTYAYLGSDKYSFENKAMFRICTNDIENGFNEVIVHKADDEEYDYVGSGPSWEGHDCLQIVGLRNKYGFVDTTGTVVIPIKYDDVDGGSPKEKYTNYWSGDGLMSVCINSKWGYIDRNDSVVVPIIYDKVEKRSYGPSDNFHPGITRVLKNGLVGGINHIGEFLLSLEYDEIENNYKKDLFFVKKDNKYGFFNTKYQLVIPFKYDFTSGFNENEELCAVGINGKYGYIDKSGNEVIPLTYDFAAPFYNGLAAVVKNNKLGYINHSGEIVIPLKYEVEYAQFLYDNFTDEMYRKDISFGSDFGQYIAFVKSINGKWGIINRAGELLVDYKYDRIKTRSSDGSTWAIGDDLVYIDIAGNEYQTEEERSEKSTEKMANQGFVEAQLRLGSRYLSAGNYELAHEWLLKAEAQGSIDAVKLIAYGYEKRGEYKLAYDWYRKAISSGDIESMRELGDLIYSKSDIKWEEDFSSQELAIFWYENYYISYLTKAPISQANKDHCVDRIGYMYYNGVDSHRPSYEDAFNWFKLSDSSYAKYMLGFMYYHGRGVQQSYSKAIEYFENSDDRRAKFKLGDMYENGIGIEKNIVKAIEYYKACKGYLDSDDRIQRLSRYLR